MADQDNQIDDSNINDSNDDQNGSISVTNTDATHDDKKNSSDSGETISKEEYEKLKRKFVELSAENKKYRQKASDSSKKAEESEKKANEALDKTNKLHTSYEQKLIRAELKAAAVKEGLIDIDAFKMVDLSHVKLSDDGDVIGVEKIISDLKTNKSYLFKSNNSSTTHESPNPTDNVEDVSTLTDEEYAKKYPRKWRR